MPLRVLCVAALARPTGGLSAPVTGGLSAPAAGGLSASAAGGLLAPAKWNVVLDLGRSEESRMPADWAASGARFFVQSEVELVYDAGADDERKFLGRETRKLAASPGTFTGLGGKFEVAIRPDAEWALSADEPRRLRFWLDFFGAVANAAASNCTRRNSSSQQTFDALKVSEAKRWRRPSRTSSPPRLRSEKAARTRPQMTQEERYKASRSGSRRRRTSRWGPSRASRTARSSTRAKRPSSPSSAALCSANALSQSARARSRPRRAASKKVY